MTTNKETEIYRKIRLLLLENNVETKGWENMLAKIERQDAMIDELEKMAKPEKTLLGRIVKFPMADSYAMYVITKVNAKTVRITWLDYSDAWVDDRVGKEANLDRTYAEQQVFGQDRLFELFSKKKQTV